MIYKKWHEPMTALEAVYHLRFKAPTIRRRPVSPR